MGESETKVAAGLSFRKFARGGHEESCSTHPLFENIVRQFCTLGQILPSGTSPRYDQGGK